MTDGGLETELVFRDEIDLPGFAAFPLLDDPERRARLRRYYDGYLDIARQFDAGFIVETPTWRANPDWGSALGYSLERPRKAAWCARKAASFRTRSAAVVAGGCPPNGGAPSSRRRCSGIVPMRLCRSS